MAENSDGNSIIKDVQKWMLEFVEKPNPLLGGWAPCPYAREARVEEKVAFSCHFGAFTKEAVLREIKEFENSESRVSVMIFPQLHEQSLQSCIELLQQIRQEVIPWGFFVLMDHPERPEPMNGVDFSNGKYGLLLIQRVDDLLQSAKALQGKGYYDHWSKEHFERVVLKRAHLINELFEAAKSESS